MAENIIVSKQDANQVLRLAYDDDAKALRTVGSAATEVTVVQPDGALLHVTVDESALPTGAATEAKQDDAITVLESIDTKLTAPISVDIGTMPLPTGASTEAKQDVGNASLASIDTKLTSPLTVSLPTNAATESTLNDLNNKFTSLGQKTGGNSVPVVIAADQPSLEVNVMGSLVPEAYDYQSLTYVASGDGVGEIETVTYKLGGASGTLVGVLTLAYDNQNRLTSVTRS